MLDGFINNHNVLSTTRLVDVKTVEEAQNIIGIQFGKQLKEYILKYGYLSYKFVELYGINLNQKMESDLVTQTLYIHKYFPETKGYIAVENQGDGDYFMVDNNDNVYEYDSELKELSDIKMKLFDYILDRFNMADGIM